jgi:hypothetical protein
MTIDSRSLDAPICSQPPAVIRVISLGEDLKILCSVDASPSDVTFYWTSNLSQFRDDNFVTDGLSSTLIFKPYAKHENDVISCWATNLVGRMKEPCLFSFISANAPSQVSDCKSINQTTSSLAIYCAAGYDGGLAQTFYLELYNDNQELIMNETNTEKPVFVLKDLSSGNNYNAIIYSTNEKGKSDNFKIKLQTLKLLNKKFSN